MAMPDTLSLLDEAIAKLIELHSFTSSSEIADALYILSMYREQYVEDNSQFGMGA